MSHDAETLAVAVEELQRLPRSPALEAAIRHLQAAPRVRWALRRRRALQLFDEVWSSGEVWTRDEADRVVARRVGVAVSTVRGWRWARDVFGEPPGQQGQAETDGVGKETSDHGSQHQVQRAGRRERAARG